MKYPQFFFIFFLVCSIDQSHGQTIVCTKLLEGKFGDITVIARKPCILSSVNATTITIQATGNLTVKGFSAIEEIIANDGAIISLKNRTYVGSVTPTKQASISVAAEKSSFVQSLFIKDAKRTTAEGPFGAITSVNSGSLHVYFSSVNRNIRVQGGGGILKICGTTIEKETVLSSRYGIIALGNLEDGCPGSVFTGALNVTGALGNVTLHSSVATVVSITDRIGNLSLSSSSVGKTIISRISGDVNISSTTANRFTFLQNIEGAVAISGTGFLSGVTVSERSDRKVGPTIIKESSFRKSGASLRLLVERRGLVNLTSNNFFNGTAALRMNGGPVKFMHNGDVDVTFTLERRLAIIENNIRTAILTRCIGGAALERNVIRSANLASCTGGISLVQNSLFKLSCTGNEPAPVGKENSIALSASGQCKKFA